MNDPLLTTIFENLEREYAMYMQHIASKDDYLYDECEKLEYVDSDIDEFYYYYTSHMCNNFTYMHFHKFTKKIISWYEELKKIAIKELLCHKFPYDISNMIVEY